MACQTRVSDEFALVQSQACRCRNLLQLFGRISHQWTLSAKCDSTNQLHSRIHMLSKYFWTDRRHVQLIWLEQRWCSYEQNKRSSEEQYSHTESDRRELVWCSNPVQSYFRTTVSDPWWKCYSHHLRYHSLICVHSCLAVSTNVALRCRSSTSSFKFNHQTCHTAVQQQCCWYYHGVLHPLQYSYTTLSQCGWPTLTVPVLLPSQCSIPPPLYHHYQ